MQPIYVMKQDNEAFYVRLDEAWLAAQHLLIRLHPAAYDGASIDACRGQGIRTRTRKASRSTFFFRISPLSSTAEGRRWTLPRRRIPRLHSHPSSTWSGLCGGDQMKMKRPHETGNLICER